MVEDDYEFNQFDEQPRPMIGKKLPQLEMEAFQDGTEKTIKLGRYKGTWLVLVFYPSDFTFICPTELEELAGLYDDFQKEGAEILSVSTDTIYSHKAWHDQSKAVSKIKFPMIADPAAKLSRALGVYLEDEGVALRGSFIIDPDGIVRAYEVNDNSIGRSGTELLRKLQAAKFVRASGGAEVCPASWKPGNKPLKPGMDLVGKL